MDGTNSSYIVRLCPTLKEARTFIFIKETQVFPRLQNLILCFSLSWTQGAASKIETGDLVDACKVLVWMMA